MAKTSRKLIVTTLLACTLASISCEKKKEEASVDAKYLSGTLVTENTASTSMLQKMRSLFSSSVRTINCVSLNDPANSAQATVDSMGSFAIPVDAFVGVPVQCILLNSSDTKIADFAIIDSASRDLDGNPAFIHTFLVIDGMNLGELEYNVARRQVTVPFDSVGAGIAITSTPETVFDPTGTWTVAADSATLATGIEGPCTTATQNDNTCQGPKVDDQLYLKLWTGNPSTSSVLQVWDSESSFDECGSAIGIPATIKTANGLSFSEHGAADSNFTFINSATFAIDGQIATFQLTDHWKMDLSGPYQPISISGCGPRDLTIHGVSYKESWTCGPDSSGRYLAILESGCTETATAKPILVDYMYGQSCIATNDESPPNYINTKNCTGTVTVAGVTKAVACKTRYAVFNDQYATTVAGFAWADLDSYNSGSGLYCPGISTSTTAGRLASARCFSDYYQKSGIQSAGVGCLPKVKLDWAGGSDGETFLKPNFRSTKNSIFEIYTPFPDGQGGTVSSQKTRTTGVKLEYEYWEYCNVIENQSMSFVKISDSQIRVTYQNSEFSPDADKVTCQAAFPGTVDTHVFLMNKQ